MEKIREVARCPGLYCGRYLLENGNWSECGACPRGFKVNETSLCAPCTDQPVFYDWLYLGFMVLLPLIFHIFCIDNISSVRTSYSSTTGILVLHLSAFLEVGIAAVLTLYLADPMGTFEVRSCRVRMLSDWYTLLHNPNPNFEETIHCTQEAVYPLYTMVLVFYAFSVCLMMLIRPWLAKYFVPKGGKVTIYAALYLYPILALLHSVFGGLIYYSFPYIIIILSVISSAGHFAVELDQTMRNLILSTVRDVRNAVIVIGHWALHAYGIVALTELKDPVFHLTLMALVPLPAIFYILTARFTDPHKVHTD
ncbi:hypothetical protein LSTR_LSTR001954 [Laodelphax striatellus]|uniref:JNK1/MAPK8-associated membrane protein n=1 Tax=Laodelphax striatellus TaxID=195883 RepID=A0A482XGQ9_LAOST|nr:hypothetical protein LSTR_LSTR001954 [Laodelphax striatellus]